MTEHTSPYHVEPISADLLAHAEKIDAEPATPLLRALHEIHEVIRNHGDHESGDAMLMRCVNLAGVAIEAHHESRAKAGEVLG